MFSSGSFSASVLKWRFLIHFHFILYRMKDKNLTSFFCKWKSSFASTICPTGSSLKVYSCFLCQNLSGHRFAIAFPGPVFYYAIGLTVFLWRNQAVFITVALKYNLRSDIK